MRARIAARAAPSVTARMTRASLIETYGYDFVDLLRAKGLHGAQILLHVAKTAASPVLTVAGLQLGFLLGGSVLIETIFSWPGVGRLLIQAISFRDYPLVQGCILFIAVTYVTMNLLVDLVYGFLDPRIRYR